MWHWNFVSRFLELRETHGFSGCVHGDSNDDYTAHSAGRTCASQVRKMLAILNQRSFHDQVLLNVITKVITDAWLVYLSVPLG